MTASLFLKKFDQVRDCLAQALKMTAAEREVTLRLLRVFAYYGLVYPKESQITKLPGCSKATYWRTIKRLKDLDLVQVVNRYVLRPEAQISNLYRMDKLVVLIARYLAEHGHRFYEAYMQPFLAMPGYLFWSTIFEGPTLATGPPGRSVIN